MSPSRGGSICQAVNGGFHSVRFWFGTVKRGFRTVKFGLDIQQTGTEKGGPLLVSAVRFVASGKRGRSPCRTRGALPPSNWKATLPTQAQAGGRPAVSVMMAIRRKTSPRPRAFRLLAHVVVGEAGRRAAFFCARADVVHNRGGPPSTAVQTCAAVRWMRSPPCGVPCVLTTSSRHKPTP